MVVTDMMKSSSSDVDGGVTVWYRGAKMAMQYNTSHVSNSQEGEYYFTVVK